MADLCKHCGKTESEHHAFNAREIPRGCVCEPRDWGDPNNIPPVCRSYEADGWGLCKRCEHDAACHATKDSTNGR